eukprot:SAG22_NODE_261_length_13373_cov_17.745472_2_plen_276_part_00
MSLLQLPQSLGKLAELHSAGKLTGPEFAAGKANVNRAAKGGDATRVTQLPQSLAQLAELHATAALTAAEFAEAKATVLCEPVPPPLQPARPAAAARLSGGGAALLSPPSSVPALPAGPAGAAGPSSGGGTPASKRQRAADAGAARPGQHRLPAPSAEQQLVLDEVGRGHCVAVCSVAGSGKTTLMLQIAKDLQRRQPVRRARIVTYNRALKDECEERIRALGLADTVQSYTLHGLVAKCAGQSCKNDTELNRITKDWCVVRDCNLGHQPSLCLAA